MLLQRQLTAGFAGKAVNTATQAAGWLLGLSIVHRKKKTPVQRLAFLSNQMALIRSYSLRLTSYAMLTSLGRIYPSSPGSR